MTEKTMAANLAMVRDNIKAAAYKAGREPGEIKLLAVTKKASIEDMQGAVALGLSTFGENKVQQLLAKKPLLPKSIEWHFIGNLQTNKVKAIVSEVQLVHSLDRWALAEELHRRALELGTRVKVLVQINVSGEQTKSGLAPGEAKDFIQEAGNLAGIQVKGLMTMAPLVANPEETRDVFRELRLLSEMLKEHTAPGTIEYLSMGMSNDYRVAVEEGANIIRLGTALFKGV